MNAQLEEMLTMKRVIDGAISPLQTHEWRGIRHFMKPIPDPLCFDPESANPNLRVSIDLTQVKFQPSTENLKDRRHCFEPGLYVLAMPGFQSGLHYWEVDVGLKSNWIIGVVKGLVERKGITELSPPHGYFVLRKHQDYEFYGLGSLPLMVKTSPIRIGVSLDLIRHHLAFYDADTAKMIYEYSDCSLDKGLFAFFCP
ncbi:hypothetical protein GDO86_014280 [Hymenochirus boettgeri]|uniref:B30.2/SPRY domain-containing protein n=1 Tax=Hymenochirus boettgeri TaxID=247094 RepID=A0A8T2JTE5_9PIPI|nr:hypothetical protein GDO86_014280 [Hymenochirus boettgeri]